MHKRSGARLSWEQAVVALRGDPKHHELIFDSYLTSDLLGNCRRFLVSREFSEVKALIARGMPGARDVVDMPAGNGIATYAFAKAGFRVVAVEPDPSAT